MGEDDMDDEQALTRRVQHLEDVLAIQQVLDDYGLHLDRGDFDAYASLFAEDGVVDLGPHGQAKGRAAIKELVEGASGPPGSAFRIISNPHVEVDGDRATSSAMFTVLVPSANGGVAIASLGHHSDELRREDGRWVFARRSARILLP
jgi:uncharacterized protein (TIGR02246 family)